MKPYVRCWSCGWGCLSVFLWSNSAELQLESSSTSNPGGFDVGHFITDRRNQSQAAASISHHLSLQTAPGHLLAGILNYTGVRGHQLETVVAVGVTVSFTSWHLRARTHTRTHTQTAVRTGYSWHKQRKVTHMLSCFYIHACKSQPASVHSCFSLCCLFVSCFTGGCSDQTWPKLQKMTSVHWKAISKRSFFCFLLYMMSQRQDILNMVVSGTEAPPTCSSNPLCGKNWGAASKPSMRSVWTVQSCCSKVTEWKHGAGALT